MFADPRSIWLKNGMGGVKLDKDEDGNINVLKFSLNIIHGPRKNLTFAADQQRHKSKLPAIEHNGDDTKLPAIELVPEPYSSHGGNLLSDVDDIKHSAIDRGH